MNLKDRLIISNQNNVKVQNENGEYVYTTDEIFSDSKEAGEIIRDLALNNRNIVFVHNRSFDSNLFINYIQILLRDKQLNFLDNFEESKLSDRNVNLIKSPNINSIVKIFEYIIYGYKPFIFNVCFESTENIIEKLSAVISVNFANLSEKNINTLISSSNCIFVVIEQNDNSFVISNILEISDKSSVKLTTIFTQNGMVESQHNSEKEEDINSEEGSIDDDLMNYDIEKHINNNLTEKTVTEENDDVFAEEQKISQEKSEDSEQEETAEEEIELPVKKENKYKLLRDKVRKRRKENI